MMNGVGGTSLHYWAQSWRLSPWDFKVVSETTKRYGASRLPRGSTVEDWPFGIEEIERYYDIAERELGVSGKAGNIGGTIDRRGNIFEAPRRREYPMPPLRWTDWHDKMAAAAKSLGWHPFPGPAAINTRSYENRPGCAYHGFCARGGCHVNAKGSTAVTTIPKAQKTGNLEVVTEAHVTEVNVDNNGQVTGVTYVKGTEVFLQPASVVLLATYTYENVRTLLLSKSKAFPNGLANNRGQVGRHYMTHATGGSVQALFPENLNNWYGLPAQGVAVDDFADDNFDHSSLDFIGGGNLFAYSDRRPIAAASMTTFGKAPQWGSSWKAFVKQNADRWHGAYMQKTTLPYRGQLSRSRPHGEGSARHAGLPDHGRLQGQRAQSRRVRRRQEWSSGIAPLGQPTSCGILWARWDRRRTRMAGRAWATTPRRTSSIDGASRTRCRISAFSARQ